MYAIEDDRYDIDDRKLNNGLKITPTRLVMI